MIPFSIDNQRHRLADVLNELLTPTEGKPFDIATAYFAISGYREVQARLHKVGAFRLLIGSDPQTVADIGLKPNDRKALQARLRGDLEAEAFTPETLKLVEDLIPQIWEDWDIKDEIRSLFGGRIMFFPMTPIGLGIPFKNDLTTIEGRQVDPYHIVAPMLWMIHMTGHLVLDDMSRLSRVVKHVNPLLKRR